METKWKEKGASKKLSIDEHVEFYYDKFNVILNLRIYWIY